MKTLIVGPLMAKLFVFTVLVCSMLAAGIGLTFSSTDAAEDDLMTSFPVSGNPTNLVAESNGRTWFTLPDQNAIGSLVVTSTVDYAFTSYTALTQDGEPYDLVYDERGAVWFTLHQGNKIARLDTTTGQVQEFAIPTVDSMPTGITLDGDGNVWFSQKAGNKLGKFDPNTEIFTEYPYVNEGGQSANVQPEDVIYQPSGCGGYSSGGPCVWSTSPSSNRVYFLSLESFVFDSIPTFILGVGEVAEPWHGALDSSGVLWITTREGNRIGRYSPGTLSYWRWYSVPSINSGLSGIAINSENGLTQFWFTESTNGQVGQMLLNPSNLSLIRFTEFPLPATGAAARPFGIGVDNAGNVWIADSTNQRVVRWSKPYSYVNNLPLIRR